MILTVTALARAGCIFTDALLGLGLQRLLPGQHLSKERQAVVKLSAGTVDGSFIATLLAKEYLCSKFGVEFDAAEKLQGAP